MDNETDNKLKENLPNHVIKSFSLRKIFLKNPIKVLKIFV
jgi:hypothetical protein